MFDHLAYDELIILHLVMMEAKFHADPDNPTLQGSHRVADMAENIIYALIAAEAKGQSPDPPGWSSWRLLTNQRTEYGWTIKKLRSNRFWSKLPDDQRTQYVRDLLSPLYETPEQIEAIMASASGGGHE